MEILVGLQLGKPTLIGSKKVLTSTICGFGIERMNLEIPAIRHDDPVPQQVMNECKQQMIQRRKRVMSNFIANLPFRLELIMSQANL